jgi:hypothetical protein
MTEKHIVAEEAKAKVPFKEQVRAQWRVLAQNHLLVLAKYRQKYPLKSVLGKRM